jgi:hypothetical protein
LIINQTGDGEVLPDPGGLGVGLGSDKLNSNPDGCGGREALRLKALHRERSVGCTGRDPSEDGGAGR